MSAEADEPVQVNDYIPGPRDRRPDACRGTGELLPDFFDVQVDDDYDSPRISLRGLRKDDTIKCMKEMLARKTGRPADDLEIVLGLSRFVPEDNRTIMESYAAIGIDEITRYSLSWLHLVFKKPPVSRVSLLNLADEKCEVALTVKVSEVGRKQRREMEEDAVFYVERRVREEAQKKERQTHESAEFLFRADTFIPDAAWSTVLKHEDIMANGNSVNGVQNFCTEVVRQFNHIDTDSNGGKESERRREGMRAKMKRHGTFLGKLAGKVAQSLCEQKPAYSRRSRIAAAHEEAFYPNSHFSWRKGTIRVTRAARETDYQYLELDTAGDIISVFGNVDKCVSRVQSMIQKLKK